MAHPLSDEICYRMLRHLADHPDASQRSLAGVLGISLGKVNYCLRELVDQGWIKARNFRNSRNKSAYAYLLTPKGMEEKISITYAFLRRKLAERDTLAQEIERLSAEVHTLGASKRP